MIVAPHKVLSSEGQDTWLGLEHEPHPSYETIEAAMTLDHLSTSRDLYNIDNAFREGTISEQPFHRKEDSSDEDEIAFGRKAYRTL